MRRQLLVTIVGAVVVALVLAGLGTLALAGLGARRHAEGELRTQVEAITESLSIDDLQGTGPTERPRLLAGLREALELEGVGVLTLRRDGTVAGDTPEGITLEADELEAVWGGATISGRAGDQVYAAATVERGGNPSAVVLSDRIATALGNTVVWFLLAGGVVTGLAALVAARLARTLTAPLRRVDEASRQIADGDLGTRVPAPRPGARDEVADLSRSVNAMARALERSREVEQQFLLSVSHDLRTPLTSIEGYAEALADGTTTDVHAAGAVIVSEARRLDRLVRDLLALARLEARRFSLEASTVDLHDLVEACVDGFGPQASAAGISVTVKTTPAIVVGDADRLAQVVANLLDNAISFARREVRVDTTVTDGRARVAVSDDGPGIAAADAPHVFERLYVARHPVARRGGGTGLGLAIVRELVTAMGGTTGVDPSPLSGTTLWFELPTGDP